MENYIIANRTDVGRIRQVNEDSMATFDSPNGHVVVVCDGMGGQAAGDVASGLACDIIRDILTNNTFASAQEAITRAILAANQGILHRAVQNPNLSGMGSTCVILIIQNNVITYGWVGDSRIYLLDNHVLRQLSRDQSYVQALVDSGEITEVEAENHPQKNEIVNALGIEEMTPPEIGVEIAEPGRDMIFMLCSDGLSNMVNDQQIERELNKTDVPLREKADKLVFLANQYGGPDNITIQLVEFGSKAAAPMPAHARPRRKQKNDNRMYVTILAALVTVILCCGVYYFCFYQSNEQVTQDPSNDIKKTIHHEKKEKPKAENIEIQPKSTTTTTTTTTTRTQKKTNDSKGGKDNSKKPKGNNNIKDPSVTIGNAIEEKNPPTTTTPTTTPTQKGTTPKSDEM